MFKALLYVDLDCLSEWYYGILILVQMELSRLDSTVN
jgi:hypothetical protein